MIANDLTKTEFIFIFSAVDMNLKLHLLLLLILPVHINAQQDIPLRFENIPGLSQNTVYAILKDKQGFMWIATANGLNRFDGLEMRAYKPAYEPSKRQMEGRIIRSALLEDEQEQIWFGSDRVVNCFKKKQQVFTQHKLYWNRNGKEGAEGVPQTKLFANPLIVQNGYTWFASAAEGLFALNTETGKCFNYPVTINDEYGNNIPLMYNGVFNGKDKLWFASRKGVLCFDLNSRLWSRFLPGQTFFSILLCRDTLYLGSDDRIDWFDTKSLETGNCHKVNTPQTIKQGLIRRIITDEKRNVWAGDQEGNVYYKPEDANEFIWRGNINGNARTNYPVYCMYVDTTGNLWIGADVLGLLKADISTDRFKKYPDALTGNNINQDLFVYSIYEDEEDNMWLGTFQNGIFIVNKKTRKGEPLQFPYFDPKLPYGKSVPLIAKDSSGNLWTSYSGYLYIKEKGKKNFISLKMPVPASALQTPQLSSLSGYNNGWLIGTNIGLYSVTKKENNYSISYITNFGQSRVINIWQSPEGKIWIVPESGGVMIFNKPDDVSAEKRIFTGLNVKSILYDGQRHLVWISTTDGLLAYHSSTDQYRFYTEKDGLLSNFVYGVINTNDELWASTNNGLSKGKLVFKEGTIFPEINFINYTVSEGLPVNEFNTGAFYKGSSGTLYFGSVKGVVWFRPEDIRSTATQPNLQLTRFMVNEEEADSSVAAEYINTVSLPYYKNNLFFQFRGIDFNNANKVRYKYQLEGWDKDWVYSNTLNEVRYNNLPNGNYTFKVKAEGSLGVWSDAARTVTVLIHPPFWKTWWFYTLAALAVLLTIVLITRFFAQQKLKTKIAELEKQKELDKERQRISREMHDDIGAGLTQITLMSESAKNKLGATGNKELDDIGDTSRKLVNNMSEIIWSLNPENKTLDQLCSYLREQLNKQLEYSGMEYSIQLPEHNENITLSNEQRRNILLVTKEIVNNAIKYSKASTLNIKGEHQNEKLFFEVIDNGIGFDTAKTYAGNGLKNISQRIKELEGNLKIESEPGRGSSFIYSIPLKRTTT
jgi:signal transduction histidine kinase/ligand-binding sensor domain-containing protein